MPSSSTTRRSAAPTAPTASAAPRAPSGCARTRHARSCTLGCRSVSAVSAGSNQVKGAGASGWAGGEEAHSSDGRASPVPTCAAPRVPPHWAQLATSHRWASGTRGARLPRRALWTGWSAEGRPVTHGRGKGSPENTAPPPEDPSVRRLPGAQAARLRKTQPASRKPTGCPSHAARVRLPAAPPPQSAPQVQLSASQAQDTSARQCAGICGSRSSRPAQSCTMTAPQSAQCSVSGCP
mmetsp:Transcript_27565/g.92169  ORF Transcript_27565/g.92169 Transcript_27565/m.92169 type:complete len:237 (+) Transcript_27565:485-1195(+)